MNQSIKDLMLSKSLFLNGLQCYKSLYLHKYHPELKDEISETQNALFQSGKEVGILAQKMFPGGVEIPYEGLTYSEQIKRTASEIDKGATTIYEATFSYDEVFAKIDILHKGKKGWELYEVKSATDVKDVYLNDIAVQFYVVNGSDLPVSCVSLVHINKNYVRKGDIEVKKLFTTKDVTDETMGKQGFIMEEINKQKEMLKGNMPKIDIGDYCSNPYVCNFKGYCWQHIPANSIFSLKGVGVDKFELYKHGIMHLRDVPKGLLSRHQRIQLEGALEKKNVFNQDKVKKFLDSLWYPLYFLDFETTYMNPIPMFEGTKPYQEVPFQYSLHYLENENAELRHREYLAPAGIDPRKKLIEKLLNEIPDDACVLVYNKSFEAIILKSLKGWFPEWSNKIVKIIMNIRDLMEPFKKKDIYYWQFNGSYSIKNILPVLVPELSYEGMEISDSEMPASAYFQMWESKDSAETEHIRKALLEYCKLDTLAMVRIVEKLKELLG